MLTNIGLCRTNGRDHPFDLLAPNTDHNDNNKGDQTKFGNCLYYQVVLCQLILLNWESVTNIHFSAYFMWASAVLGSPGSDTELSSPKISLKDKICFTFWLDMTVLYSSQSNVMAMIEQ